MRQLLTAAAFEALAIISVGALFTSIGLVALGGTALISVNFVAVIVLLAGAMYFLASAFDEENPDHAMSHRIIKAMTILAGLHSKNAIMWTFFMQFRKYW